MEPLVRWDRDFRIWHYTVSYSQLLLRSIDVAGFDTRIDVLFSNVAFMHMKRSMSRLYIDAAEEWRPAGVDVTEKRGRWYVINDGEFYVHATHCQWHEDQGDHHTPSRFGPLRGTE